MWYNSATHGFSGFLYFVYTQNKVDYSIYINIYNEDSLLTGRSEVINFTSVAGDIEIPTFSPSNYIPIANAGNDTVVSINDTVNLKGFTCDSFSGHIVKKEWDIGNKGGFVATATGDTFFIAPISPCTLKCIFRVTDSGSNKALDTMLVSVIQDIPVPNAGRDTNVALNTQITLNGTATQQFGRIIQYKWDFNGDGIWDDSSSVTGTCTTSYNTRGLKTAIFGVLDDDGNLATDTVLINVVTYLKGTIASDQTLLKANSPYLINGDLSIPSGIALTIEPGVIIDYLSTSSINVQGKIIGNGTKTDSVIMNGGEVNIRFMQTNLSNSKLAYIRFTGSKKAFEISAGCSDTLTVSHANLNANVETDPDTYNSSLKILFSLFLNMTIVGDYANAAGIFIDSGTILGCAVNAHAYHQKGINISNSQLVNCALTMGCCGGMISLTNSRLSSCSFDQDGDSQAGASNTLNILASHLLNSRINMDVSTITLSTDSLIYDSDFKDSICVIFGNASISSSVFIGNSNAIGIQRGPTNYNYDNHGPVTMTNSAVSGFKIGIRIMGTNQSGGGSGAVSITNSNLLNNLDYDIVNMSTYDISATNNHWGTPNSSEISNAIFDYYDNITYGKVIYSPFSTQLLSFEFVINQKRKRPPPRKEEGLPMQNRPTAALRSPVGHMASV